MFVTAHVKVVDNKVDSIFIVSKNNVVKVQDNAESKRNFLKNIENGRYAITRAIFERIVSGKAIDYHCFDFIKTSFIISDPSQMVRPSRDIVDLIEDLDENFRIDYGMQVLTVYTLSSMTCQAGIPTNDQLFFHRYVNEMSDEYLR